MVADFARIRPAGYAANTTFTSVEASAQDAYWPSVMRRDGVSNVTGTVAWKNSSTLSMEAGSAFNFATVAGNISGASLIGISGTSQILWGANTSAQFTGANSTCYIGSGGFLNVDSGGAARLLSGSTFVANNGSAVTLATGSTFTLVTTYPLLDAGHPGRTQIRKLGLEAYTITGASWAYSSIADGIHGAVIGAGAAGTGVMSLPLMMEGATLTTCELLFTPDTAHAALPANNISASIKYRAWTAGAPSALFTVGAVGTYGPVSLADYKNGNVKSLTIPCGTPTIDQAVNGYILAIDDEYGAGVAGLNGTIFHALKLTYTITDLRQR